MEHTRANDVVTLPRRALIALCGPAGAGKSTFAGEVARRNHLAPTAVVSSDACRLMLCDETNSLTEAQWATLQPNTFQLFVTIVGMRLAIGRPGIADGVNLNPEIRAGLLGHARTHGYPTALIAFAMSVETCLAQNAHRARHMPEWQIRGQHEGLQAVIPHLAEEGWDHVVVLDDQRRAVAIDLVD